MCSIKHLPYVCYSFVIHKKSTSNLNGKVKPNSKLVLFFLKNVNLIQHARIINKFKNQRIIPEITRNRYLCRTDPRDQLKKFHNEQIEFTDSKNQRLTYKTRITQAAVELQSPPLLFKAFCSNPTTKFSQRLICLGLAPIWWPLHSFSYI